MSAELQERFDAEVQLERGHSGVYDVVVDGKTIFSKNALGRFPEEGEIAEVLEES